MKHTANLPHSPGSSYARLTTSENAVRNQAPDTQVSNQPIPTLSAYETPPLPDWNDVSDSIDDASWIDHSDLRLNQRSREQLRQEHWHTFSKQSQTEKKLKFTNEDLEEFSHEKFEDLIAWIKITNELVGLDIDASLSDRDEANTLMKAIMVNTSLKTLFLRDEKDNIVTEEIKVLMESIKTNTSLQKLGLDMYNLDSDGFKALGEALKVNTSLKKLELVTNHIDSDGFKALAEALKVNTSLNQLKLNILRFNLDDFIAHWKPFKLNPSLNALNLFAYGINVDGLKFLIEALKINTTLTNLKLPNNEIDNRGSSSLKTDLSSDSASESEEEFPAQPNFADQLRGLISRTTDLEPPKNEIDDSGPYSSETDLSSNSASESEEEYPAQPNYEDQLKGLIYRNKLWPLTHPAGVGLSNMINHQYPDLINTFPEEVGNLITQYMLWMNSTNDNPMTKFQEVEKNLFELAYGTKVTGVSPTPTS